MISNENIFQWDILCPPQVHYCRRRWCIQGALHGKFTGLSGFRFCRKLVRTKLNKAQTKLVNITGVNYFCGIWYCLRSNQQDWCQRYLIILPLLITLTHNLRQHTFLPWPPPPIECAAADIVRLHQRQNMPSPGFGHAWKIIWLHFPLTAKRSWYDNYDAPWSCQPLHQPPHLWGCIHPPPPRMMPPLLMPPPPKPWDA